MKVIPSSLNGRLIAGVALFTIVVLGVTLAVMDRVLDRFVTGQIDQRLDNKLVALASQVRVSEDGMVSLAGDANGPPFDKPRHKSFWLVAGPRNMVESAWLTPSEFAPPSQAQILSMPGPPAPPRPPAGETEERVPAPRPRTLRLAGPGGEPSHLRIVVRTFGTTPVTLLAAAPLRAISDPLREAMTTLAVAILVLGMASLVAGIALSRLLLRPLTRLRAEVADVRSGRRANMSDHQPIEVRPLVEELNGLLAQNAATLARARKHVANLAHGLKTPLATLSLGVERLDGAAKLPLQAQVASIERRVRHHLGRARAAALDWPGRVQTPLTQRLHDIADALHKIYADRRIALTLSCPAGLAVACEQQDIDEIFGNLLDNAFKYTRTRVVCTVRNSPPHIVIDIIDDGPGLDPADIDRVLRPGQRLDEDIPGFGFGLPIARELVELYGGDLTLARSEAGLLATVHLPAAR